MRWFVFTLMVFSAYSTSRAEQNVLMIVVDDLSPEILGIYNEGIDPAKTPTLDALAQRGVLFENAWANPICSPSRASILTGRYGFRTGVGNLVQASGVGISANEWTLPQWLGRSAGSMQTAAFGKWHLGGGPFGPNHAGFDHFFGNLEGLNAAPNGGYYQWQEVRDGIPRMRTTYNTTAIVDSVVEWVGQTSKPWFAYVAFNAAHRPFDAPPPELHSTDLTTGPLLLRHYYKAIVEALDTELARLFAGIPPAELARTHILFVSDNGVPPDVAVSPIASTQAKGTFYQGGVRVPLIIAGPAVQAPGTRCGALVSTADLFATTLNLASVIPPTASPLGGPIDSIDLSMYLVTPNLSSLREAVFSEAFLVNGQPFGLRGETLRGSRYKAIWLLGSIELYDLFADPYETIDLMQMGPLSRSALRALMQLQEQRDRLLLSGGAPPGT